MFKDLSKEAKKELINKYNNTKKGKNLSNTLNRLFFEGIFLFFCFIVILIAVIVIKLSKWYLVVGILSMVFGCIFLVGQHIIRIKEYNNFLNQLNKIEKNKLTKMK